jgi:hypothetical protein
LAENIVREQYIIKKQLLVRDAPNFDVSSLTWTAVASELDARNTIFNDLGSNACNALFDVRQTEKNAKFRLHF